MTDTPEPEVKYKQRPGARKLTERQLQNLAKHGVRKGEVRNPNGQKGKKKLSFVAELNKILAEPVSKKDSRTKLQAIASQLVNHALAGNLKAMHHVMERVDGKVPMTVHGNVDHNHQVTEVHWHIVTKANGHMPPVIEGEAEEKE